MVGNKILHYKIEQKIGEGGMGKVYKAHDTKLDRNVAIKLLPRHIASDKLERDRFKSEAKAAAALNQPDIATIHAIEETDEFLFIVMEFIEGQELSEIIEEQPLPLENVIKYSLSIANGIHAAHEKGISHRDIKSSNIMVTPQGLVKIMDFGLAKFRGDEIAQSDRSTAGTLMYMSPQQALGGEVDYQTDIWSFGVVLYEMVSGRLPFTGEYNQAILYSIINSEPETLPEDTPPSIKNIIDHCLQKEPDKRPESMESIIESLNQISDDKHLSSKRLSSIRPKFRLAVLPFTNISSEPEDEYFADGLTEELISTLSKISELRIISRSSVAQYKVIKKSINEIGNELKVGTILQGSIRKSKGKLRISVQLIDINSEELLWSEDFNRKMEDIFSVQSEIATEVADSLKVRLVKKEKKALNQKSTENIEAFRMYLKGRYYWNKRTKEGLEKGVAYFQEAIEEDPTFALAYSGLADAFIILGDYNHLLPQEAYPKARAAAERALEIDDTLVQAYTSLARIKAVYDWDWPSAEEEFKNAIESNSKYATVHHWYAINLLVPLKRFEEAEVEIKIALDLDPLSMIINATAGLIHYYAGNTERAIHYYQKTIEMDPHFGAAYYFMSWALAQLQRKNDAIAAMEKAISIMGDSTVMKTELAYIFTVFDHKSIALQIIEQIRTVNNVTQPSPSEMYSIAALHAANENVESAVQWLERALNEKSFRLIYLDVDPWFSKLKTKSNFIKLLSKIGFPE